MAIKFSQKLVLFNNTANNYINEYYALHRQFETGKIDNTLGDSFDEIRIASEKIKNLQVNFAEEYALKKEELTEKWLIFGNAFEEYLDTIITHIEISEELITLFNNSTTWSRIWNFRKTYGIFSRLNNISRKCQEKGGIINQLIATGKYI